MTYVQFFSHFIEKEITSLHEDKVTYEATAKESLSRVVKEKLDAERRLAETERALSNTEDECSHLQVFHRAACVFATLDSMLALP